MSLSPYKLEAVVQRKRLEAMFETKGIPNNQKFVCTINGTIFVRKQSHFRTWEDGVQNLGCVNNCLNKLY